MCDLLRAALVVQSDGSRKEEAVISLLHTQLVISRYLCSDGTLISWTVSVSHRGAATNDVGFFVCIYIYFFTFNQLVVLSSLNVKT